jgi:hypothetical protein
MLAFVHLLWGESIVSTKDADREERIDTEVVDALHVHLQMHNFHMLNCK